jgi:hypothetical protein
LAAYIAVGGVEQRTAGRAVVRVCSHAEGHGQMGAAGDVEQVRCDCLSDPLGDRHRVLGIDLREHGHELLAAPAAERVHRAQHLVDQFAQFTQGAVTRGMPAGVVDLLEVVDVQEQQRAATLMAL